MEASVAAASSGLIAVDDNFCLRLSICGTTDKILLPGERRRDADTTEFTDLAESTEEQNYDVQTESAGPAGEL